MASKYLIKKAIKEMLNNLSQENFDNFCSELLDREDGPSRAQVEDKKRFQIADLLVQTYTSERAAVVSAEILRAICCEDDAQLLEEKTGGQSSTPGPTAPPSAGAPPVADNGCTEEHFVDKHRAELVERVTNIATILDKLLDKKVVSKESYDTIRKIPTPREKMRELYESLNAEICKDIFYKVLEKHEPLLIDELKKKK